jgi:hypothetical protein
MADTMMKTACPHMDEPCVLVFQIQAVLGGERCILCRDERRGVGLLNILQESKLSVMNGGYSKRAGEKFREDILQNFAELQNSRIEESVYRTLQSHEVQGGLNVLRA